MAALAAPAGGGAAAWAGASWGRSLAVAALAAGVVLAASWLSGRTAPRDRGPVQ